jgi:hypothetical protein
MRAAEMIYRDAHQILRRTDRLSPAHAQSTITRAIKLVARGCEKRKLFWSLRPRNSRQKAETREGRNEEPAGETCCVDPRRLRDKNKYRNARRCEKGTSVTWSRTEREWLAFSLWLLIAQPVWMPLWLSPSAICMQPALCGGNAHRRKSPRGRREEINFARCRMRDGHLRSPHIARAQSRQPTHRPAPPTSSFHFDCCVLAHAEASDSQLCEAHHRNNVNTKGLRGYS